MSRFLNGFFLDYFNHHVHVYIFENLVFFAEKTEHELQTEQMNKKSSCQVT